MKSIRIDMTGKRYGRLIVISYAKNIDNHAAWLCLCDCGNKKIINGRNLRNGRTSSCGCYHREIVSNINKTHEMSNTPTYRTWCSMLNRCYNPNQESYSKYGALGIGMCDEWRDSFENFFADMKVRPKGKTLDRINPFGNYEPNNCRWATATEQTQNTRGRVAIAILEALKINPLKFDMQNLIIK